MVASVARKLGDKNCQSVVGSCTMPGLPTHLVQELNVGTVCDSDQISNMKYHIILDNHNASSKEKKKNFKLVKSLYTNVPEMYYD